MNISEQLIYTTTRIEGIINNSIVTTGTGFFFQDENNRAFLVTNKHVIQHNAMYLDSIRITLIRSDEKNEPNLGKGVQIVIPVSEFIGHPDPIIDVAICNISKYINEASDSNLKPFYVVLKKILFRIKL